MMHKYYLFLFLFIQALPSFSQSKTKHDSVPYEPNALQTVKGVQVYALPENNLDRDFALPYQQVLNDKNCPIYSTTNIGVKYKTDSISYHDYIFKNNGDMFKSGSFRGNVYPLFSGDYGPAGQHDYYAGLHTDGSTSNGKFSYSVNYISGYLNGPSYLDSIIKSDRVVPGMGYAYGNAKSGYSYQYWDGYVSYQLNNIFNFELGKGKQFWGDGYRSLLLSDVSSSYPYLKITTNVWHIQYTNLFTVMQDVEPNAKTTTKNFPIKYGSFHFLTWNASKRFNFSLFEAVIWHGNDNALGTFRGFEPDYLNPVIFYRPVEFSLGSPDNELVGGTFKIKASKNGQFYGQVLIDDFVVHNTLTHNGYWTNKQGLQFGFKEFNLFNTMNLTFQTEINYVRPYTYSESNPAQNYSNYGQPLGDPMGANFIESASFLTWFSKNFIVQGSLLLYKVGYDTANSKFDWGQNMFISYDAINNQPNQYGNYVGQGVGTYYAIVGLRFAYIISPKMHVKAELGMSERLEKQGPTYTSSPYIYIGIKTSLGNLYNDF